jgi:hypothetical protein
MLNKEGWNTSVCFKATLELTRSAALYQARRYYFTGNKVLPRELLITESQNLAARINEKSMILAGQPIQAASVEWSKILQDGRLGRLGRENKITVNALHCRSEKETHGKI